jgi:hypothetical protein
MPSPEVIFGTHPSHYRQYYMQENLTNLLSVEFHEVEPSVRPGNMQDQAILASLLNKKNNWK